jgi:hypothetical protein
VHATSWYHPTDYDEVCRRAGGRRRYNAHRQFLAEYRRRQIVKLLVDQKIVLLAHGYQTRLAEHFGVSRSTICRDLARIEHERYERGCCPACGLYARNRTFEAV